MILVQRLHFEKHCSTDGFVIKATRIEFVLNTKYFIGTGGPKEAHPTSKVYKSYVFSFFPQRNKQ